MTPNELLLWLSARKQGSWPQFRGAVERLDLMESEEAGQDTSLSLHQRVRLNLERLGHVEFDAAGILTVQDWPKSRLTFYCVLLTSPHNTLAS
jgi:hypothetical protein